MLPACYHFATITNKYKGEYHKSRKKKGTVKAPNLHMERNKQEKAKNKVKNNQTD
jgi:hypothetical protein